MRSELEIELETTRTGLASKIDAVRKDLDGVKQSVAQTKVSIGSLKVWGLRLFIDLAASLLLVMAHGFKWL